MSKPHKILYPFWGKTVGGSHLSTASLIRHLDREKFLPLVVMQPGADKQRVLFEKFGISFDVLDYYVPLSFRALVLRPFAFLRSVVRAKRYLVSHGIDLVHADDGPGRYVWFYASVLARVPYVHVQRTPLVLNLEKRISFRFMAAAVANSDLTRGSLPSLPARVVRDVCYPVISIDESEYDPGSDRAFCLLFFPDAEGDETLVGFLSNLQGRKRPAFFIEMAARLKARHPGRFKFLMVGAFYDGLEEPLKELVREAGLEGDLVFTDFQPEPYRFLSGFDILVAPAVNEAFGRILVEAMMLGTPVAASDDGGHREIIKSGHDGVLVAPDHMDGFVDAVLDLSQPKYAQAIIRNARAAARRFDAVPITRQFEAIYRKVLEN